MSVAALLWLNETVREIRATRPLTELQTGRVLLPCHRQGIPGHVELRENQKIERLVFLVNCSNAEIPTNEFPRSSSSGDHTQMER